VGPGRPEREKLTTRHEHRLPHVPKETLPLLPRHPFFVLLVVRLGGLSPFGPRQSQHRLVNGVMLMLDLS
jgi:hypothetical protein